MRITRGCVIALVVAVATGATIQPGAAAERYRDEVFADVVKTTDITYGHALAVTGETVDLQLDLYEPLGDTAEARPLIVWAHGGGFWSGNNSCGAGFCVSWAKRGYLVASIRYRLRAAPCGVFMCIPEGAQTGDLEKMTYPPKYALSLEAMARDAQHDMLAAVRWGKHNAAAYRIDPEAIAVGGSSAGAYAALNANFGDEDPGDSGNPGYSSRTAAAIALSGMTGTNDLDRIDEGDPPIAMFTGTNDTVMSPALQVKTCALTTARGNVCEPTIYPGEGHGLEGVRADFLNKTSDFLYRHVVSKMAPGA